MAHKHKAKHKRKSTGGGLTREQVSRISAAGKRGARIYLCIAPKGSRKRGCGGGNRVA